MRDEDAPFDDCDGWTEASFIRRFSAFSKTLDTGAATDSSRRSTSFIFDLATHGRVADLQRALTRESGAGAKALPSNMPELFSTIGLLENSWKGRRITFGEAIRGLFTIREVVQNLESGRTVDPSRMHFFGSGLIGVADGEQHDFGPQIVAEKLYVSGWRTEVNVRGGAHWLLERSRAEPLDFVGISVGCDESLSGLADLICELRERARNRTMNVIVGGAVFAYSTDSFGFLGADCIARTADDAISFLNARVRSSGMSRSH
ncbi:MAG: hypothetical protein ACK4MV_03045 [Beijerinckiaceae bacterium]